MMNVDSFPKYEENFKSSTNIIARELSKLEKANGNIDIILSASVEIEGELGEAEGYYRAMEIEFRMPTAGNNKTQYKEKIDIYKTDLERLKKIFIEKKTQAESYAIKNSSINRQKLMEVNQRLDNSTNILLDSQRLLNESSTIGDTILSDLNTQKEILLTSQNQVQNTKTMTSEANRILKIMSRRELLHKIIIIFIIIGLGASIIAVGYYGISK